jgi:inorganic phosphate transporter, PiT family
MAASTGATAVLWTAALLVLASAFAVVSGINDGGALLSPGLRIPSLPTMFSFSLLVAATACGPVLFGTKVAATFIGRLVRFGPDGRPALTIGVAVALVVVLTLSLRGLPTSLTLAVVGGLTGAGLGWGLPVSARAVVMVLVAAAAAPVVSSLISWFVTRSSRIAGPQKSASRSVGRLHRVAFPLQCLAYGANDGQKMIALFAVASSGGELAPPTSAVPYSLAILVGCGALFGCGALVGLPKAAASLGNGILPMRPLNAATAELSAALAVLGSAALGFPVSMTQSVAGGLFGAGIGQGVRRIRWRQAARIGAAWVLTLPLSVGAAAVVAMVCKGVT